MSAVLRTIGKMNAIVLFAALVTWCLFFTMQLLIVQDGTLPAANPAWDIHDITMPEWTPDPVHVTPKPEKPVEPPTIPDNPVIEVTERGPGVFRPDQLGNPPVELPGDYVFGPADGNAMPIARIEPVYPDRALARGLEGFVIVEFDVSETGQVINAKVLGAQPPNIFDQAALRAIGRWKYNPRIIDGKAVKMSGLQTRFTFSLRE